MNLDFFKKWFNKEAAPAPQGKKMNSRSFKSARRNRYTEWINASLTKINSDINADLLGAITKCRDLAKNDPIIRSYLSSCQKNIIGKSGFILQSQLKDGEGKLNNKLNDEVEWLYYDWGKAMNGYITMDGTMGSNDLDALILRTLLIDGEVFIRIHRGRHNPYGLSFELIDSASIDFTKIREATNSVNAIVLGIEVDKYYKPVAYYLKPGNSTSYQVGVGERVPAKDMIHIFKKEFPQQVRGIPPLNATIDDLKQLEDYKIAEIMAAKTGACLGIFYERNAQPVAGDYIRQRENEEEEIDRGEFVQDLEPGMATVAPTGYSVKSLTPNHPNNGFEAFNKAILKQVASSLGVSYAKLLKDYEAVNYSSLREGTLDEAAFYAEMQAFLIESWKELEFKLFLEALVIEGNTTLKASEVKDLLKYHTWISQRRAYFDKGKDILAEKYAIELGLKSPIMLLEEEGLDPAEVLKSYALWVNMCKEYGLNFEKKEETPAPDQSTDQDENEALNKNRD